VRIAPKTSIRNAYGLLPPSPVVMAGEPPQRAGPGPQQNQRSSANAFWSCREHPSPFARKEQRPMPRLITGGRADHSAWARPKKIGAEY